MGERTEGLSYTVPGALLLGIAACNILSGVENLEPALGGDMVTPVSLRDAGSGVGATPDAGAGPLADAQPVQGDAGCVPTGSVETVVSTPDLVVDDARSGTAAWSNLDGAKASGGGSARATLEGNGVTHWLVTTGYHFTLPPRASVRGIEVTLARQSDGVDSVADQGVALLQEGGLGRPKATLPVWSYLRQPVSYGGPTDLWETTWTVSSINASTFGVAIAVRGIDATGERASIDAVRIAVTFERCER